MKHWGIRNRVLLVALLPAITVAVALAGYIAYRTSADYEQDLRDYGIGLSRQLAAVGEFSTYAHDRDALRKIAQSALAEPNIVAAAFFDGEGEVLAWGGPAPTRLQPIPLVEHPALLYEDAQRVVFAAPIFSPRYDPDDDLFVGSGASLPASLRQGTTGWIRLDITRAEAEQRKREALHFALVSSLFILAIGGGLAIVLSQSVTRPILRLRDALERIRQGELDVRVPADSGSDLQRLEEGLNAMATALLSSRTLLEERVHAATSELQERKEEAERANLAKSRFLLAASHDLRQPLHALSLFSSDLQRAVASAEIDELRTLSRRIGESIETLSGLLDTLLDISRLDIGGVRVETSDFPLAAVFARLHDSFARNAAEAGLRLRCRPTSACVRSDPALLEQLLANLVGNAIRYTREGSVLVAARRRGTHWRIEIRDSGIGIAPEHQEAVFEEFFQVGNRARVDGEGLGLGLAIARRMARLLGATLELRSQVGDGSVFAVSLPLAPPCADAAPAAPAAAPTLGLRLLLILPPTPELLAAATHATGWGYRCDWVGPAEALAIAGDAVGLAAAPTVFVTQSTPLQDAPATAARIVLGGDGKLPAGAFRLALPLRPAKLRALLARVAAARH